jgi:hypothetical protein
MNRVDALAQFNKINKVFIMILSCPSNMELLNHDMYLYKQVSIDKDKEKIIGNYDDFRIVSIDDEPMEITEDTLNLLAREKIVERYPIENQLTIIGRLLEQLADASAIECEDLKEMNDYIAEVKRVNKIRKEFYAANPDYRYVSTEEFQRLLDDKYEGGIQEYGGKIVSV